MQWNLRKKATMLMVFLVILPVLIMGITSSLVARNIVEEKTNALSTKTMEKLSQYISRDIQYLSEMVTNCTKSSTLIEHLKELEDDAVDLEKVSYKIRSEILSGVRNGMRINFPVGYILLANTGDLFNTLSFSPHGNTEEIKEKIENEKWYDTLSKRLYDSQWIGFRPNWILGEQGEEQFIVASNITRDNKNYGVLLLTINRSYFSKFMENFKYSPDSIILLMNENENTTLPGWGDETRITEFAQDDFDNISSEDSSKIFNNGKEYIATKSQINLPNFGPYWSIYMLTPLTDITRESDVIAYVTLALVAFTLVSILVLVTMVERHVIKPITNLSHLMKEVQNGDLSVRAKNNKKDEIGQLGDGFNQMIIQLNKNILQIQEEEQQKLKLEIQVLQAQINPHFIRNTLNTVRWMAELKKATGISRAITSFINLMDYSFKTQEELVTIDTEIQYLNEYIYLQRLRYQNRFQFDIKVSEELRSVKIMRLLLQPIVENSILHGLEEKKGFGKLTIEFYQNEDALLINICDDGVGISQEKIEKIMAGTVQRTNGGNHIGITNVMERIKLHYGEEYGLEILSSPKEGTCVKIHLPLLSHGDEENTEE